MESQAFALVSLLFLIFGLFSRKLHKSVITAPMVFVFFGLILGPNGLNWLHININNGIVRVIAELTLVLVLFTDASRIDLYNLKKEHDIPIRLLTIGLILTIIIGAIVATFFFKDFNLWEACILAAVLAPTDAALGHIVVSSPKVPTRMRQAINIESGLNDGLVLPIIVILISFAGVIDRTETITTWIFFIIQQLVLGAVCGVVVGFFGGKLFSKAAKSRFMSKAFEEIFTIALALFAFSLASIIQGNGFLAAFIGGLTVGNTVIKKTSTIRRAICDFAAVEGLLISLLLFFFFGAVFTGPVIHHLTWKIFFYAILSLTLVRMIPVAISLIGCKLKWESIVYLGWFGPRGVASIVFGLMVLEDINIVGREEIFLISMTTILISIFAHGLTAVPGAKWYAHRTAHKKGKAKMEEHKVVTENPPRIPHVN